jgi:hypothetical protein
MEKQTTEEIIESVVRRMSLCYYFWGFIYVALGLLTVILPILITVDAFGEGAWFLAPLTAIVAAIFAFLKPHEYATGYDAGTQEAWKTQIAYRIGQLNDAEVSAGLGRAIDITTFKYGGKIQEPAADPRSPAEPPES